MAVGTGVGVAVGTGVGVAVAVGIGVMVGVVVVAGVTAHATNKVLTPISIPKIPIRV